MDELAKELNTKENDRYIRFLGRVISYAMKVLSLLMAFVVVWALIDVIVLIYQQFRLSLGSLFEEETILSSLGSVLIVLIAVEIFLNVIHFLTKDVINVSLVLATALTAIARKVIIIDYSEISDGHLYATAAIILSVGLVFWLVTEKVADRK